MIGCTERGRATSLPGWPEAVLVAGALALLATTGCESEAASPTASLTAASATTTATTGSSSGPGAKAPTGDSRPFRIAMSAAFVSEAGIDVYSEISEYLADKTGNRIEFLTGFGYQTINEMLISGAVDVGFVCGLPYVLLRDRETPAVDLLAAPVMKSQRYHGKPKYYSDLIVRKDSDIGSIADLKGRTYVFNEEISNSGYNMPRYRLLELGFTKNFFAKVLRSGSHEESIRMVAEGEADASFVDSLVLEYDLARKRDVVEQVRVLESIGPAGIPPVVVGQHVPAQLRNELRRHLLAMHRDPRGRAILERALVDRFVPVDDGNYDDIRIMKQAAEKAGFAAIK